MHIEKRDKKSGNPESAAQRIRRMLEEQESEEQEKAAFITRLESGRKRVHRLFEDGEQNSKRTDVSAESVIAWEDLKFLRDNELGLRHVSTERELRANTEQGFTGDALAIHNVEALVPVSFLPTEVRKAAERLHGRPELETYEKNLTPDQRQATLTNIHEAITKFLDSCLNQNEIELQHGTVQSVIEALRGTHSFLILRNARGAYDTDAYVHLGKTGRRPFKPSDVLCSLSVTEILEALPFSAADRQDPMTNRHWQQVTETIFKLLYKKLKEARPDSSK